DVNGDGRADLLARGNAGDLLLYLNVGSTGLGTFGTPSVVGTGWGAMSGIALGDVKRAASNVLSHSSVSGDVFPPAQSNAATVLSGDFDGDGRTDLALTGRVGWNSIPVAFPKDGVSDHPFFNVVNVNNNESTTSF